MGLFRRGERGTALQSALSHAGGRTVTEVSRLEDRWTLPVKDGKVRDGCFFCGLELEFEPRNPPADVAVVVVDTIARGTRMHGICHVACAERPKGSIAPIS